jgi:ABC-2 type transport system permease protein
MSQVETGDSVARVDRRISLLKCFVWSLRKELWEHRSIYWVPLVVAAFVAVGLLVAAFDVPASLRGQRVWGASTTRNPLHLPYSVSSMILMATMILGGGFYCVETLYAERRDRSIVFWKSLPVSDAVAVVAKFVVPMVVLPLLTFLIALCAHMFMLGASAAAVSMSAMEGVSVSQLWAQLPFTEMLVALLYFIVATTLWYAPVFAWLMFISVWAKRGAFVWAVVPPIAVIALERIAFKASFFTDLIKSRLNGAAEESFSARAAQKFPNGSTEPFFYIETVPDPAKLFSSGEFWIGLVVAAALLIATIRMRRLRDPI